MKKQCPNCGWKHFITVAHVMQEWLVDEDGYFEEVKEDCLETTHDPNDDNNWTCSKCGYTAAGSEFNVKE